MLIGRNYLRDHVLTHNCCLQRKWMRQLRIFQGFPVEGMKGRLPDNFDLYHAQSCFSSRFVGREDLGVSGEHLREELFTVSSDAGSGFLGLHLVSKGKFEILLKVPLQALFLFLRERIANGNIIFGPLVEANLGLEYAS